MRLESTLLRASDWLVDLLLASWCKRSPDCSVSWPIQPDQSLGYTPLMLVDNRRELSPDWFVDLPAAIHDKQHPYHFASLPRLRGSFLGYISPKRLHNKL